MQREDAAFVSWVEVIMFAKPTKSALVAVTLLLGTAGCSSDAFNGASESAPDADASSRAGNDDAGPEPKNDGQDAAISKSDAGTEPTGDGGVVLADGGMSDAGRGAMDPTGGDIVVLSASGATILHSQASASFYAPGKEGPTPSTFGACTFYDYSASPLASAGAGTITVSGGSLASPEIIPAGQKYGPSISGAAFTAGQTMSIAASGADIPAFTFTTGAAPSGVTVTAPVVATNGSSAGKIPMDRAHDVTVTWTGYKTVRVELYTFVYDSYCTFQNGSGTIPHAMLAKFPAADPNAHIYVTSEAATDAKVPGASVSVHLEVDALIEKVAFQ